MRARLLFALAFVVVISALLVVRQFGYLGGRQDGGPLDLMIPDAGQRVEGGQSARFRFTGSLHVREVRVQNVRPRVASPELAIVTTDEGRPFEDATLEPVDPGSTSAIPSGTIDLRADRAGLYYAIGLIVDYRRGQRRFRRRDAATLCIAVHTQQKCDLGYNGPGDARVAQVGGPSRYPGATFTTHSARYRKPGEYRLRVTLTNQTRGAIDVADLTFDADRVAKITSVEPAKFRLAPHGHLLVKLRVRFPACQSGHLSFARVRAEVDGDQSWIPLSQPLELSCELSGRR